MEKKIKLLVVCQYFWPETFRVNDICYGLRDRGFDIDVLTSLPNVPQGKFYDGYGWFRRGERVHEGIRVERVGVVQRGRDNAVRWVLNCASFAVNSLFHLPRMLRRGDYDAVFVFNNSPITMLLPARVAARRKKIPNVVYVLDIWPDSMYFLLGQPDRVEHEGLVRRVIGAVCRWLYRGADRLLISSEGMRERLTDMGLTQPIDFFPNYAEPFAVGDSEPKTRAALGIPEDARVVGFAGNVGTAQGLDKLVEAAAETRDENLHYLIVGDGPALPDLKAKAEAAGVAERFTYTGWVASNEVPGYLSLCDALLVSLKGGGVLDITVPAKLQTYMYAGKPVVAFTGEAGAALVREAGCGVTAAPEDAASLAAALRELGTLSPETLTRMGERGREYCLAHFERETLLDRLEGILRQAVEENRRNR